MDPVQQILTSQLSVKHQAFSHSPTIGAISASLAKAQGEFRQPVKNRNVRVQTKTGGAYTFDYATLDEVLDCVRKPLADGGLAVLQFPTINERRVLVTTLLSHSSGEWFSSTIEGNPEEFALQKIGGAVTYLRRYAIASILSLAADEDDDGNLASGNQATGTARSPKGKPAGKRQQPEPSSSEMLEASPSANDEVWDKRSDPPAEPATAKASGRRPAAGRFPVEPADKAPDLESPEAIVERALGVIRAAPKEKLEACKKTIESKPLPLDKKAVLSAALAIRETQFSLCGTSDPDTVLTVGIRGTILSTPGSWLDAMEIAIATDGRLSDEDRERLLGDLQTRREIMQGQTGS